MTDQDYLITLTHFGKFGPASLHKLAVLKSWSAAFHASFKLLTQLGLNEKIIHEFIDWRKTVRPENYLETMRHEDIKAVTLIDDHYPPLLKNIYQPPPLLYYRGHLEPSLFKLPLAVVGSRRPSAYGQMAAGRLVAPLAQAGLTIVSGLAFGIDALAHHHTLEVGGRTVAVLGSGLSQKCLYPINHRFLAEKIINQNGAIISEFPPLLPAAKFTFPQRNRLIAGLSLGLLIIEAAAKSGSLITAHYALEQNREVMAVPGNIFSEQSAGTNHLIKIGAKVVTKADDVLEVLNLQPLDADSAQPNLPPEELAIMKIIGNEAKHLDEISALLKIDIGVITSTLTIMELKGLIKNIGNANYIGL